MQISTQPVPGAHRASALRRVAQVAMLVNAGLVGLQLLIGWLHHSQALIADAVHSLSDLLGDGLVLLASVYGTLPADSNHPYGHARIETAFTIGMSLLLALAALGIGSQALWSLWQPAVFPLPGWPALGVALLALLAKEALYHYTVRVARQLRSSVLQASAWHHRSDAFSSLVVLLGVAGTWAGWRQLDALAALLVAAMIGKIAWDMAWRSLQELVDTGLEPQALTAVRQTILRVPGVRALHQLRTRRMGGATLVDVHILVPPRLSVSEAHYISDQVRLALPRTLADISDATIHIDPEDDETSTPSLHLPPRTQIVADLQTCWQNLLPEAWTDQLRLHYLGGRVEVELVIQASCTDAAARLQERLRQAATSIHYIGAVRLLLTAT